MMSTGPAIRESDAAFRECKHICNYQIMREKVHPYNPKLNRMAECESGKDWDINTHNGYYGGLQFSKRTWRSVGGRLYPHQNRPITQKYRAVRLIKRSGYGPWPICGSA